MRPFLLLMCVAAGLWAAGEVRMSLDQLRGFIKSSIQNHLSDKDIADYLKKVRLSNKLEDRDVEELQGLGAGPKTVTALHDLRDATSSLPAATPPPPKPVYVQAPPPNSIEQKRILGDATEYAHNYSGRMPDFICVQTTRRSFDPHGGDDWHGRDTITERLTYFEHKENYTVTFINGRAVTNVKHEQLGGTTSSGEFASMMEQIFSPSSGTDFEWERWGKLDGRVMFVYAYRVPQSNSQYRILAEGAPQIVVGYHGLVFVGKEDSRIYRITLQADDLPAGYPVKNAALELSYAWQDIGPTKYLLPLKSTVTLLAEHSLNTKNEVEFRLYRKFTAESVIKDLDPEPLPDAATKEQSAPPVPAPKKP